MSVRAFTSAYCPSFLRPALERIENSPIALRLARGTFWSMAGAVISRGLMLVASILVARMLGKTGFGELGMIRSTVGMFGVFAGFGLGITATKHVAEFCKSDPERAGRIIGMSWLFAMLTGGLMALGLFIFAPWLAEHTINAPHLSGVLRIGALILFINALNGAQTGALAGFEAFKTIAYVNLFVGLISFPILIGGAYYGGLVGAVWGLVINLGVNWLMNHLALRRESRRHDISPTIVGWHKELSVLLWFSLPSVIGGIMVGPVLWISKSMLANQEHGYAELGSFALAESWRVVLFFVCGMITQATFPVLAQLYSEGKRREFKKTLFAQFCINGAIVFAGVAVVVLFSNQIVAFYGLEFKGSSLTLALVALGAIPKQLAAVVGMVNKCVGNIWWGVLLNTLWAIVYLASASMLIQYGAVGLAWATVISYCCHLLFTTIYAAWVFKVSPKLKELLPLNS